MIWACTLLDATAPTVDKHGHIAPYMTGIRAWFVTSVVSAHSTATDGAALISFLISFLMASATASIKSFCILFDKPENTVDVCKCLVSLLSFSVKACTSFHVLSSLPRKASWCLSRRQVALMRSFRTARFSFTSALWMLMFIQDVQDLFSAIWL